MNYNDYQIKLAAERTARLGLSSQLRFKQGDFMKLDLPDASFDAVYAIEATCHAPDKVGVFSEAMRILKPGGRFAVYEWVVTPKYDASNPRHVSIKEGIEIGNSLPTLATGEQVVRAMRQAGFKVLEARDVHANAHSPQEVAWYAPLSGEWSMRGFASSKIGGKVTHAMVSVLEALRIAPKGTVKTSGILTDTQQALIDSGKLGIFTPGYLVVAEKPLDGSAGAGSS